MSLKRTRIKHCGNADSMATWFSAVFDGLSATSRLTFGSTRTIPAAATGGCGDGRGDHRAEPAAGRRTRWVKCATYQRPVIFVQRHLSDGFTAAAAAKAPSLAWNRDDGLRCWCAASSRDRRTLTDHRGLTCRSARRAGMGVCEKLRISAC